MAEDTKLKEKLDAWEASMASGFDLVREINDQIRAEAKGKPGGPLSVDQLPTDPATRKQLAADIRQATEDAIRSSPELTAKFINEIDNGRLTSMDLVDRKQADSGGYDVFAKTLLVGGVDAWKASRRDNYGFPMDPGQKQEMIGTMGHEIDHSKHRKEDMAPKDAFAKVVLGTQDTKGPRDYTAPMRELIDARGTSESRAHLEYYNSIVRALPAGKRGEADVYDAIPPGRRPDFFGADGHLHPALKTVSAENPLLPQSPGNVEALRHSYFDRTQFGDQHATSYRSLEVAGAIESILKNDRSNDIAINLKALGVDYRQIQPDLASLSPSRSFIDTSETPPTRVQTNQAPPAPTQHTSAAPSHADYTGAPAQSFPGTCVPVATPHPLYAQAMDRLHEMGSQAAGYGDNEQMRRMAGTLAALAQERNLRGIESVVPSLDGKGLIATWSNPGNPLDNDRVYMDKTAGANQPIEQSLQRLSASTPEREQRQELAAPQQNAPQLQGFSR